VRYRSVKGYKYASVGETKFQTDIFGHSIDTEYANLNSSGLLTIKDRYHSDGPSGVSIDTKSFISGSFAHDCLYGLIRMRLLPITAKGNADRFLREQCLRDGMSRFRAWYVYQAVKYFGGSSCVPGSQDFEPEIFEAP